MPQSLPSPSETALARRARWEPGQAPATARSPRKPVRRMSKARWRMGAALVLAATQASAFSPATGGFELGMSGAEAARLVGRSWDVRGGRRQVIENGTVAIIVCDGVVMAIQEVVGATARAYAANAQAMSAKLGAGDSHVSQTEGGPHIASSYWDAGGVEVVLSLFSGPGLTRVVRTTQIPGLPGCD